VCLCRIFGELAAVQDIIKLGQGLFKAETITLVSTTIRITLLLAVAMHFSDDVLEGHLLIVRNAPGHLRQTRWAHPFQY